MKIDHILLGIVSGLTVILFLTIATMHHEKGNCYIDGTRGLRICEQKVDNSFKYTVGNCACSENLKDISEECINLCLSKVPILKDTKNQNIINYYPRDTTENCELFFESDGKIWCMNKEDDVTFEFDDFDGGAIIHQ